MFGGSGRAALALLALVSVLVTQLALLSLPARVYFPFEHMKTPPGGGLAQLPDVREALAAAQQGDGSRGTSRKEMRAMRRTLERARQDALSDVVITQYTAWHRKMRHDRNARKLIWTGLGNAYGIGDRFRGILHAYLCAVLSKRVLVIKWDDPFPLELVFRSAKGMNVFFDPMIDGPEFVVCASGVPTVDLRCANKTDTKLKAPLYGGHPECLCSLADLGILLEDHPVAVLRSETPPNVRKFLTSVRKYPNLEASKKLLTLAKNWQGARNKLRGPAPTSATDDLLFVLIFKSLLRPSPHFLRLLATQRAEVRSFIPERLRRPPVQPRRPRVGVTRMAGGEEDYDPPAKTLRHVSVHARLGIGLNESVKYKHRFGLQKLNGSTEWLAACMAGHAAQMADDLDMPEPQRFYVATDTAEFTTHFKKEMRKRSPEAIVVGVVRGSERMHSSAMNAASVRDREQFLLTAADLFFLSAGDALLSLPSGFANLARWLGAIPHAVVRVPKCAKEHWHTEKTDFAEWPDEIVKLS